MIHLWTSHSRRGDLLHVTVEDEVFTFAFNHDGKGAAPMVKAMLVKMRAIGAVKYKEARR